MDTTVTGFLIHLLAALPIALAIDWAFYDRVLSNFIHLGEVRDSACWSRTLLPRVLFTLAAAIMAAIAMTFGPRWLLWIALVVFLAGQFYALARVLAD